MWGHFSFLVVILRCKVTTACLLLPLLHRLIDFYIYLLSFVIILLHLSVIHFRGTLNVQTVRLRKILMNRILIIALIRTLTPHLHLLLIGHKCLLIITPSFSTRNISRICIICDIYQIKIGAILTLELTIIWKMLFSSSLSKELCAVISINVHCLISWLWNWLIWSLTCCQNANISLKLGSFISDFLQLIYLKILYV